MLQDDTRLRSCVEMLGFGRKEMKREKAAETEKAIS